MANNKTTNKSLGGFPIGFTTGIDELDSLLGLKEKEKNDKKTSDDYSRDTISILIRGGQGAGKTTLALQILSNQLSRNADENNPNEAKNYGLFLSLERPVREALIYANNNFNFFKSHKIKNSEDSEMIQFYMPGLKKIEKPGEVVGVDGQQFKEEVEKAFAKEENSKLETVLIKTAKVALVIKQPFVDTTPIIKEHEDEKSRKIKSHKEAFQNDLAAGLIKFIDIPKLDSTGTLWIIIDSLNVLERIIYQRSETEKYRAAIQGLAGALKVKLTEQEKSGVKIVILFTGEYHTPGLDVSGASGESFFCDVEILLSQEPIIGKARTDPRNSAAAGYNIELHHNPHGADPEGWDSRIVVETRAFCRVLKSRFSKNQSRRCFYKMKSGTGLHFDEAFPGDGHLLLFEDNPMQRKDWEELLLKDAPLEFPALRYELFDRTGQQRVFSTERCFRSQRQDTDLHLASLDAYWIKWFLELNQRLVIGEYLEPLREEIKRVHKNEQNATRLFCQVVCRVHKMFLEALDENTTPNFEALWQGVARLCGVNWKGTFESDCKYWEDSFKKCDGMLKPILHSKLRLFGEQRSDLLSELEEHNKHIRQNASTQEKTLSSIPFNANVSFLVYRKDLLQTLIAENKDGIKKHLKDLLKKERQEITSFVNICWPMVQGIRVGQADEPFTIPILPEKEAQWCDALADSLFGGRLPMTWEEVIAICKVGKKDLVIETNSFDTLLCTFLEFIWGCGAELVVDAEYTMDMSQNNLAKLYQAIFLLQQLLRIPVDDNEHRIIPPSSTLEPQAFGKRYSKEQSKKNNRGKSDWMFMRQWHSTFVDILVAGKDSAPGNFYWKPDKKHDLEIIPLPQSLWHLANSCALTTRDIKDPINLIRQLQEDRDEKTRPISEFIWKSIKNIFAKDLLSSLSNLPKLQSKQEKEFVASLNKVLKFELYNKERFKNIKLSKSTCDLLGQQLFEGLLFYLNRQILEETYPAFIRRNRGVSCWGDWHLAVMQGSENDKLAISLLNNLMSSAKISNRALRGAALPAVEEFYNIYENTPCILLPERTGEVGLPKLTYGKLRSDVFSCAKSRSKMFDYRHCMREFHGFLENLIHEPDMNTQDIGRKLADVLKRISELRDRELMLH